MLSHRDAQLCGGMTGRLLDVAGETRSAGPDMDEGHIQFESALTGLLTGLAWRVIGLHPFSRAFTLAMALRAQSTPFCARWYDRAAMDPERVIIDAKHSAADPPRPAQGRASRLSLAVADVTTGLTEWRRWWILAVTDVKQRYRRSRLGQFWLTISMAATIAGIGTVFAAIMQQSLGDYVAYLGVGLIVWSLISLSLNELPLAFISSDLYLKSYPGPRVIVVFRIIVRNIIIAGHNFVLIPVLWIALSIPVNPATLLFLPGLLLFAINMAWVGMILGTLSARFRDVPQIVQNIVQLAFFLTPIMFRPEQVQGRLPILTDYNPFASMLEVMRAPLLGQVPDMHHYLMLAILTTAGYALALPFYARFRERLVYWL